MSNQVNRIIVINPGDNVAVALGVPIRAGEEVSDGSRTVLALGDIPSGHKIALCGIAQGEYIIKYGEKIGNASADIKIGEHVHTHNVADTTEQIVAEEGTGR